MVEKKQPQVAGTKQFADPARRKARGRTADKRQAILAGRRFLKTIEEATAHATRTACHQY